MASKNISVIVAACQNNGIGVNGQLPWRLKGDMAFFKRITTNTADNKRKNAVIMGRKTWDSIPTKFRPLSNRINIVISRNLQKEEVPSDVYIASSWEKAISLLENSLYDLIENTFVIGGSSIYDLAFQSPLCERIYLTRVLADFDCDTFLPAFDNSQFTLVEKADIDSEVKVENEIQYKFQIYERTSA